MTTKITHKDHLPTFLWLASASSTDPNKQIYQKIYREGNMIISTDGRMIHTVEDERLANRIPEGCNFIEKNTKKEIALSSMDLPIPNWKIPISAYLANEKKLPEKHTVKTVLRDFAFNPEVIAQGIYKETGKMYQNHYVLNAFGIDTLYPYKWSFSDNTVRVSTFNYKIQLCGDLLCIQQGRKNAYLMPIRTD